MAVNKNVRVRAAYDSRKEDMSVKEFERLTQESLQKYGLEDVLKLRYVAWSSGSIADIKLVNVAKDSEHSLYILAGRESQNFSSMEKAYFAVQSIIDKIGGFQNRSMPTSTLEDQYLTLPFAQQMKVMRNYSVVISGIISHRRVESYGEGPFKSKGVILAQITKPDKKLVARLALAGLTVQEILKALFCTIPEESDSFNVFVEQVKTLPQEWIESLHLNSILYQPL